MHLPSRITALLLCMACVTAIAQQPAADRAAQQQIRRAQLQAQQLQQQLQEANAARARAETEKADLARRAEAGSKQAGAAAGARRAAEDKLRAADAERATLAARVADLERELADEKRKAGEAVTAKDRDVAQATRALRGVEAREADLQARFREQIRLATECNERNEQLAKVGMELIDRYRNKSVADVMRERDPVLGLADVAAFNVLQDLRDRIDAGRFTPAVPR